MDTKLSRIDSLDYLRGLSAFSILVYHYLSWTLGKFKAETMIARFGVYGVSIFYILSGLTLFHVYEGKVENFKSFALNFTKKRLLRILPLFCLAIGLSISVFHNYPTPENLFLNVTGLFGFFKWNDSLVIGGWSIGNEMVFYAFFIFSMYAFKNFKLLFYVFSFFTFLIFCYFAFKLLNPINTLTEQWKDYVNPLNQLFFFVTGVLIGLWFKNKKVNPSHNLILLIIGLLLFYFSPASGDTISLVTGVNRLLFSLSIILICFFFYKSTIHVPVFIHRLLHFLGLISYSLYLLHPVFFELSGTLINLIFDNAFYLKQTFRLLLSTVSTMVACYYTYNYYELFFIKLGEKQKISGISDQVSASDK